MKFEIEIYLRLNDMTSCNLKSLLLIWGKS